MVSSAEAVQRLETEKTDQRTTEYFSGKSQETTDYKGNGTTCGRGVSGEPKGEKVITLSQIHEGLKEKKGDIGEGTFTGRKRGKIRWGHCKSGVNRKGD